MKTFPVEITAGNGLGVHQTSFSLLQNEFSNTALGAAGIRCFHNIATDNLVIFDRPVVCEARNFPVEAGYVYNSKKGLWRLAHKQLNAPESIHPLPKTITLTEADGHESVYTWSADRNCYIAPADASGKATLRFDAQQNTWRWFHPGTRMTEYYDIKGRLTACCDALNRETVYEYNDKNPQLLTGIKTPDNHHYAITRNTLPDGSSEETLSVRESENDHPLLLQKWHFDSRKRLTKTAVLVPDALPYAIEYDYTDQGLKTIRQTDGSQLAFTYKSDNTLSGITHGTGPTQRTMEFQSSESIHEAKLGCYSLLLFTDDEKRLTKTKEMKGAPGFSEPAVITQYRWKDDRIDTIITPDNGVEQFEYHPDSGIVIRHQKPGGEDIHLMLDEAHDFLPANTAEKLEDGSIAVHRKVFDHAVICDNQRNAGTALRFFVSPEGRVTEYRYDAKGDIQSERTFLDGLYTEKHALEKILTMQELEDWTKTQDASRVSLTEYARTGDAKLHTRTTTVTTFAVVDTHGNGIRDTQTSQTITTTNIHGSLLSESTRQSLGYAPAVKTQTLDALQRPLTITDALSQTTTHTYDLQKDHQAMQFTVHADGSEEAVIASNLGLAEHWQKAIQDGKSVKRTSAISWSPENNCSRTVKTANGLTVYEFLNASGEVIYTVDETGRVTGYHHDPVHNVKTTTRFATGIDVSKLFFGKQLSVTSLQQTLAESEIWQHPDNRETVECHDLAGRLRYQINPRGAVIEMRYDNRSNPVATIQYARLLVDAEISAFKQGKKPDLPVNPAIDRCTRHFHDKDGLLIAEQDAAGFITEYIRNSAGWIVEEIRHATKATIDVDAHDFSKVRPPANLEKDAHTYHFYNHRGLREMTVGPEGQVTKKSFLANGLPDKTRIYATAVSPDFYQNPHIQPALPQKSLEDTVIQEAYDLLDRNIHTIHASDGFQQKRVFNAKTGLLEQETKAHDAVIAGQTIPGGDNHRAKAWRHDGFGEIIAEASPLLAEKLAQVEQAHNLTPERKAEITDILWKHFSTRKVYDQNGLLLKTLTSMADIYHEAVRNITQKTVQEAALDRTEYIYYDRARRPVLFLTPLADGRVLIREHTLNGFDEITRVRNYAQASQKFPPEKIAQLQGGLLPDDLRKIIDDLKDDAHDPVVESTHAKTALAEKTVDAKGFVRHFEHNAFDECILETCSDNGFTHVQEFDTRGQVIKTVRTAPDMATVTIQKTFDHPLGQCTEMTDAAGCTTVFARDRNGLETARTSRVEGQVIRRETGYDPLGRIRETVNPMNVRTGFNHARHQGEIRTIRADGTVEIETHNIHGDITGKTDGAGNTHHFTHAANGVETCHRTPLDAVTQTCINLHGDTVKTIKAGITNLMSRDESGAIQTLIEDCTGQNLQTGYDRNSLNQAITVTDAAGHVTGFTFDKNGNTETILKDPARLKLRTAFEHDANNRTIRETRGTPEKPDRHQKVFSQDALARATGETVDPDGLHLAKKQILNASGKSVALISPAGDTTWQIHDAKDQKRFEISPAGGVKEWRYDGSGNITAAITYHHCIAPQNLEKIEASATPSAIVALLKPEARLDGETCWFYDAVGRERFEVSILHDAESGLFQGLVRETQYNKASLPVKKIHYAKPVAGTTVPKASLADIEAMVKAVKSPGKDAEVCQVFDADNRHRFTLDAEGYLHEIRYDAAGRTVTEITYSNRYPFADISYLSADQTTRNIKPDPERDIYQYKFYDALGRMVFEIKGEGSVTGYTFDKAGNQTVCCLYDKKLTIPEDYEILKKALAGFSPNREKDRIHTKTFDAAGRCIRSVDACGAVETYVPDALDNITERTDVAGKVWKAEFDRANRETKTISPFIDVADIKAVDGKLVHAGKKSVRIVSEKKYDQNSNITAKIMAAGSSEERQVIFHHDSHQNLTGTEIPEVPIDNGAPLIAGYRPETKVTITTAIRYDARQKKIASQNESGLWTYFIRDNLGRLVFTIKPGGTVTHRVRDTAGRVIRETAFATRFTGNNPTLTDMHAFIKTHASPDDRTTTYIRDRRGNPVQVERGMVYDCPVSISRNQVTRPALGRKMPARKAFTWNAAGRIAKQVTWLNSHTMAETITGYDRAGNLIWEAVATGMVNEPVSWKIETSTFNSFNERTAQCQHAGLLAKPVVVETSTETMKSWLVSLKDAKDRHFGWEYDNAGRETAELKYNVTRQEVMLDSSGKPTEKNVLHAVLATLRTKYNLSGLPVVKTLADGSSEYFYYDACRNLIAKTGATQTNAGLRKVVTPLTFMMYNHHGQVAVTTRFIRGISNTLAVDTLPVPLNTPGRDPQELKLYDCRGKPVIEQDAMGYAKAFSWTATGKKSREWQKVTSWGKTNPSTFAFDQVHVDSTSLEYNAEDYVKSRTVFRDNVAQTLMHVDYNAFGQQQAEWSMPQEKDQNFTLYDTLGHRRSFMKDGVPTIVLHDFTGQEVWSADSPVKGKMASLNYDDIPTLLTMSPAEVEVTQKGRDRKGLLRAITSPVIQTSATTQETPVNEFDYDVWNNQTLHRNAEAFETTSTWNDADCCESRTLPPARIVTAKEGIIDNFRSKTTWGHNVRDEVITESRNMDDGSIRTEAWIRDATNPVMHILPDGSTNWKQVWNSLGQNTIYTDSCGNSWFRDYDLNGNLCRQTSPLSFVTAWRFNERNEMISMLNGENETFRYTWDASGNLYESFLPMGDRTLRIYDVHRNLTNQQNPDGKTLQWKRDVHGNILRYVDLGGGITDFTLNGQNRVVTKIRTGGQTSPWYDLMPQKYYEAGQGFSIKYVPQPRNAINLSTNQHLEYRYASGRQIALIDHMRSLCTDYTTNLSGQRTGVRLIDTVTGQTLRNQQASLDALGREYWIRDDMTDIHRGFTATSDIRFMLMHITIDGKTADSRGFWWDYDLNRNVKLCATIENSRFTQNIVNEYLYEKELRLADITPFVSGGIAGKIKKIYKHDNDRRLLKTSSFLEDMPNLPIAETSQVYDRADRVTGYLDYGFMSFGVSHAIKRNPNANIILDERTSYKMTGSETVSVSTVSTFNYAANSAIPDSCTRTFAGGKGTDVTRYATWARDTVAIFRVTTERNMEGYNPSSGMSLLYTGPNGEISALFGVMAEDFSIKAENRFFTTSADGNIFEKITINPNQTGFSGKRIFSTLGGEPLGQMEYIINPDLARAAAGSNVFPRLSSSIARLSGPCKIFGPHFEQEMPPQYIPYYPGATGGGDITTPAEFYGAAENGAHIHIVDIGENYESIARKVYGNAESAWLIALANGNHRLFTGMHIKVPCLVPGSRHHAETSLPLHKFYSIMQGNISPFVSPNILLDSEKKKQSFLKTLVSLLTVAVAVLLAIPSGGLVTGLGLGTKLAGMLGLASSVTATAVVTGAVAGLIDAGLQGILAGLGVKEFSLKEVITASFAAAGSSWMQGSPAMNKSIEALMLPSKAASINIAEQVTLMALGKQKQFDFIQVSTAFLSSSIDAGLGKITQQTDPYTKALFHTATTSMLNGAIRGGMNLEYMAAQLLSSSIINAATPAVMHGLEWADHNIFKSPGATPAPVQQPVRTGAKKQANASKHNIHDSERKHHSPAMRQEDFMDIKMDLNAASQRPELTYKGGPLEKKYKSEIASIKNSRGVRKPETTPNDEGFWDHIDAVNRGGKAGAHALFYMAKHPIDTLTGGVVMAFDGYNAITDSLFGISTQGSRIRNAQRSMAIDDTIDRFKNGSSATQLEMLVSGGVTIFFPVPAGATAGIATSVAIKTARASVATNRYAMFADKNKFGAESLGNMAARSQVNRLKLSTELALKEANILDLNGVLTKNALNEAFPALKQGVVLVNQSVVKELTKNGSKITDWQKMSTPSIELSSGQRVQVHFYQNRITGEINYTHSDFKVKNLVDAFYEPNAPKITTPQSILNKYRN